MATGPAIESISEGEVAPVYLVTGAEGLLVDRAVAAIEVRVLPQVGPPAFNVSSFHGSDGAVVEAIGTARTLPMMGERRLVIVRELEAAPDSFFADLESYLEHPSESTTLVLAGTGFPTVRKGGKAWNARIPKRVAASGVVLKFASGDVDPRAFVVRHAADLGHELLPEAASLLVDLVGQELARLAREVEKVTLYAEPGATLDAQAVGTACSALAEKDVWDLTAGLAARDAEASLGALHRLLEQGDAPHRLLGLVVWQLRSVLRVAELVRQGVPDDRIRNEVRMRSDTYRRLRRALDGGSRGAAETLERVSRANRAMNSARSGDRRVLEALVLDLAGPASGR